jgi:hypothetical protein
LLFAVARSATQKNPSWIAAGMGYKALPTGYDLTQNNPMIAAQRLEHLT